MDSEIRRIAVLAEGNFNIWSAKTAVGIIRYSANKVVVVIDSTRAGQTVEQALGFGGDAPIVATVEEAKKFDPEVLVVGIAPAGGRLPQPWRLAINEAIEARMEIWSGLHSFLADDEEFAELADLKGVRLWDVRRPRPDLVVGCGLALNTRAFVVLAVGSDCNIGKMTVMLELQKYCRKQGWKAGFVATGQTGILIEGDGTPLDAVPGDFMPGEVERLVMEQDEQGCDVIFVEGQGALCHPAFGAVTLGLMLGAMPDAFVLCHQPGREAYRGDSGIPLQDLPLIARQYEDLMISYKAPKVACIALNTFDLSADQATEQERAYAARMNVPAIDPIRNGAGTLWDALEPLVRKKLGR